MSELTLEWGDPSPTDEFFGAPTARQLQDAINHLCADIGPDANNLVVEYGEAYESSVTKQAPGGSELASTLATLRALVADDESDYAINFGRYYQSEIDNAYYPLPGTDATGRVWVPGLGGDLVTIKTPFLDASLGEGGEPSPTELRAIIEAIHDSV